MPFYDYFCEANGKTVEVYHPMKVRLKTWGEVCQCTKMDRGDTAKEAPVQRLISKGTPTTFRLKGLDKDAPSDKLDF